MKTQGWVLNVEETKSFQVFLYTQCVGAESDQYVNIFSFAVRCDRMWPNTQ